LDLTDTASTTKKNEQKNKKKKLFVWASTHHSFFTSCFGVFIKRSINCAIGMKSSEAEI
jgi:hypothetical protein